MSHSVLLVDFDSADLDALARAIAPLYGILPLDAQWRLRHGWGFLERDTTAQRAAELVAALAGAGVRARAIANAELREPAEPLVMLGFAGTPDGFQPELQSPDAPPRAVRWDEIAFLAAAGFPEEMMRREAGKGPAKGPSIIGLGVFLVTGIPVGLFGGRKEKEEKPVKSTRFLRFGQLVTTVGDSYLFNPAHFDFSGLGDAKQANASLNFRQLITLFAERSRARLNRGARCVLANQSLSTANYQGLHDFETELLWLLNCPAA